MPESRGKQMIWRNRLCVTTSRLGAISETFIRRHIQDIHKKTVCAVLDAPLEGRPSNVFARNACRESWFYRKARSYRREEDYLSFCFRMFLRRHRVGAILGEYLDTSIWFFKSSRSLGVPFFVHGHGYDASIRLRDPKWRAEYQCYNQAAGVIIPCHFLGRRLAEAGIRESLIHVIPCGVDLPDGLVRHGQREIVRCLAVGRMVPKKSPLTTLKAFRRAVQGSGIKASLEMIGDGPLLPEAEAFCRENEGLDITLHGAREHEFVHRKFSESDIFLQHSIEDPQTGDCEGMPVGILEAMAHGLPVISTLHSGIPESVSNGESGILVKEGDEAGMADGIVTLAKSPELRSAFGAKGREIVRGGFTWELERAKLRKLMGFDP